MLKMLIVDDEYLVRMGIKETIDWFEHDIEIIGEACDGEEGLQFALEFRPDIIITDIRMPFVDGLEFMVKLREQGLDSRVIVLSGHDEFTYAKEAMNNGAFAYILKPIENDELVRTVKKVAQKIKEERSTHQYYEKLKGELSSIKKQFIIGLLEGNMTDIKEIEEKIGFLDIPLEITNNYVVVVKKDDFYTGDEKLSRDELLAQKEMILQNISKFLLLNSIYMGVVVETTANEWSVLLHVYKTETEAVMVIKEQCVRFIEMLGRVSNLVVTVGISNLCANICDINKAYREAVSATANKLLKGSSSISHVGDEEISGYRREIRLAIKFIKTNYAKDISVETAAKELFISSSHLMHLFRAELGKTFNECLTGYRIEMAMELLMDPKLKIYEVCEKVGYGDVKYFSQIFRKRTGLSPSEYLKQKA